MVFIICSYVRDVPIIDFNLDFLKNALSTSVNVFSKKELIEDTIFKSPAGDGGPPFFDVVIRASSRSTCLQCKRNTFISQLFRDPVGAFTLGARGQCPRTILAGH